MKPHRLIVCGSRHWTNGDAIRSVLEPYAERYEHLTVIHGAASGADRIADQIARSIGCHIDTYPADWRGKGRAAGPIRNRQMAEAGADECWAFKDDFQWSLYKGGTENMVKLALEADIATFVYSRGRRHLMPSRLVI